jgi:hypothetical protein
VIRLAQMLNCKAYGKANHCRTRWDARSKECKCQGQ